LCVSGCAHTVLSVVLVDLQGVENIARCFALYSLFTSFSLLTGSPFMGLFFVLMMKPLKTLMSLKLCSLLNICVLNVDVGLRVYNNSYCSC